MGIIRNAFRKLIDHELGVIGAQLDRLTEQHNESGARIEELDARLERATKRITMRDARSARRVEGGTPKELEDVMKLAAAGGHGQRPTDPETW